MNIWKTKQSWNAKPVYTPDTMLNGLRNPRFVLVLETIHIPLWLIKDLCWLLTLRSLGVAMAIPTILVAFLMVIVTYGDHNRFLPNLSIAFWILANANWMIDEFYELGIKHYSLYPFIAGLLVFAIFILLKLIEKRKLNANKSNFAN